MPDNNDQTMTNPQAMVDAALGTTEVKTPEPVDAPSELPTLTPLTSPAPEPVVTDVSTAPSEPSITPVPTPTPAPAPTPEPIATPSATASSTPMGDDTPLSFAMPAPSTTATATPTSTPNVPPVTPLPPVEPASIPVAPVAKPKGKKTGLIVGGILLMLVALGGGVWGYSRYSVTGQVARVTEECEVGYRLDQSGNCRKYAAPTPRPSTKTPTPKPSTKSQTPTPKPSTKTPTPKPSVVAGSIGYNYNTGTMATEAQIDPKNLDPKTGKPYEIAGTYIAPNGKRYLINDVNTHNAALKYNIENNNILEGKITSNGQTVVWPKISTNEFDAMVAAGKTWAPPGVGCNDMPDRLDPNNKNDGSPSMGGEAKVGCTVWHWTTCTNAGTGVNGVGCDAKPAKTTTTTTTEENPTHHVCNPTTYACQEVSGAGADTCTTDAQCAPGAPVLACTGLSYTPTTTPKVNDKLTFTCTGSISPASAGTLSYKFRYSVGTAAPVALANKTATTAELLISACGTYSVECQTCATIAGVLTCDPTWTGATQ